MNFKKRIRWIDDRIFDSFGQIRLLFVIRNTIGFQCLLPLIRRTISDNSFTVSITEEHEGCFEFPCDEESQMLRHYHYIPHTKTRHRKWHYVFLTDHSELYFSRHTTMVATSHASTHGNLDLNEHQTNKDTDYWTRMATDPNISLVFLNALSDFRLISRESDDALVTKNRDCLITGFIKSSQLLSLNIDQSKRKETISKYHIEHDRKIVVVTSHWTDKSLLKNVSSAEFGMLFQSFPEYSFLLMGHPLLWKNHDGSDRQNTLHSDYAFLDKSVENFYFLPNVDNASEITQIADYFILDYTSYFVEACMMNKPVIFFDHDNFNFRIKEVGSLYRGASACFSDPADLASVFSEIVTSPDLREQEREKIVEYFLYQPDKVVDYIIQSLKLIGRVSGPKSKSWSRLVCYCKQERLKHIHRIL